MKDKIRIAVIGCGRFSKFFIPLFKAHKTVEEVLASAMNNEKTLDVIDLGNPPEDWEVLNVE